MRAMHSMHSATTSGSPENPKIGTQTWLRRSLLFFLIERKEQFEVPEDQPREGGGVRGGQGSYSPPACGCPIHTLPAGGLKLDVVIFQAWTLSTRNIWIAIPEKTSLDCVGLYLVLTR